MIFRLKKEAKRCRAAIRAALSGGKSPAGAGFRILMYHSVGGRPGDHALAIRVPADTFERELKEIANSGYKTFTVSEIVKLHGLTAMASPSSGFRRGAEPCTESHSFTPSRIWLSGARAKAPQAISGTKAIAITFDDGYKDNITSAAARLKKYGLAATFFVTVSYIENAAPKRWRDGSRREFMSWEDIKDISGMGFEVGSHMVRHVDLSALKEEEMLNELKRSKDIISGHISKEVKSCSYPYGGISGKVTKAANRAGYIAACSSFYGWNTPATDQYILRRTEIDGYDTINDFRLKVNGFYD